MFHAYLVNYTGVLTLPVVQEKGITTKHMFSEELQKLVSQSKPEVFD